MLFNSFQFIFIFLPVTLSGCFLLSKFCGAHIAQIWLIAASLIFYASWNWFYLPLLLISITFNYIIAASMVRTEYRSVRIRLLIVATIVDLAFLGYYKYANFLLNAVNATTGTDFLLPTILLPLGISFYTFQQLTLLADISRGDGKDLHFHHYSLFVIFFPHLIAGPIVHHAEMMPQFEKASYRFQWHNLAVGGSLFVMGLFKKAVLADGISSYVSPLYSTAMGTHLTLLYSWAAAFGFILQLYFDFSGYSEMANGLARMVGIKLPMNFNSPLKATSITEHWRRWHMTLTRFLTEYLYTPIVMTLTRRRKAKGKSGIAGSKVSIGAYFSLLFIPSVTTMSLAGLWHGAGYQFVVWGTLHGLYVGINQVWRLLRPRFWSNTGSYNRIMGPIGFLLTLFSVVIAIPFFRADSLSAATNIVTGMFLFNGIELPDVIAIRLPGLGAGLAQLGIVFAPSSLTNLMATWLWIAGLLCVALLLPNVMEILGEWEPVITSPSGGAGDRLELLAGLRRQLIWRPQTRWVVATAGFAACGILALTRASAFLYWQF
jgi:alginate O-acetyltransferase complex protein AlgI